MTISNKSLDLSIPFSDIIKMKNIVPGKRISLAQARALYPDADIIINTALFDMDTGTIISQVVANNQRYGIGSDWSRTWGIGFGDTQGPRLTWDNGVGAPEYLGPYSSAVSDGKIADGLNETVKRGRTAIGLANGKLIILCTGDGSADMLTSKQVCQHMINKGCSFAINLDGGGSSQFKAPDGRTFSTGRTCPAWLAIWLKKDSAALDEADDSSKQEDSSIKCLCTARTYTLDAYGKPEGNRYIDAGDRCELQGITADCLIRISYPTSKGSRTAYIKSLDNFTRG